MIQRCRYSEPACITPTNPDLGSSQAEFKQSIRRGIVKDASAHVFHNMLESTDSIGKRVSDVFDVIEYENAFRYYRRQLKEQEQTK